MPYLFVTKNNPENIFSIITTPHSMFENEGIIFEEGEENDV